MLVREKYIRLSLFLLTVALVGLALYLPPGSKEDSVDKYFLSGVYRSDLLNVEVSTDALRAAAGRDEVRSVVGGQVRVEALESSPFLVKVTTSTAERAPLEEAHQRSVRLLSSKLKDAALTEISDSLRYIDDFKLEAAKLRVHRPEEPSPRSVAKDSDAMVEDQEWIQERAQVLQERAETIAVASSLKLEGELEFGESGGRTNSVAIFCWLGALACFLGLLFRPAPKARSPKAREPRLPRREVLPSPLRGLSRLEAPTWTAEHQAPMPPDHFEVFFSHIFEEITRVLGRAPRRLLILGDQAVESRLAFSMRLANNLGREFGSVRLIDFDLQEKRLSERLGRQSLPGVGDLLLRGGPVEEFFSSIGGTSIQFAPAGSLKVIEHEVDPLSLKGIFGTGEVITVIDASSASPLHLVVHQVDVVLYATRDGAFANKSAREQQVLVAFRDAGLPIWGVSVNQSQFYPLL